MFCTLLDLTFLDKLRLIFKLTKKSIYFYQFILFKTLKHKKTILKIFRSQ